MLLISLYIGSFIKTSLLVFLIVYLYKALMNLRISGKPKQETDNSSGHVTMNRTPQKGKKIFSKETGDYVDYEEVTGD